MKLYYSPGACSLSPHIVLREAGVDFTLVRVDLKTKQTEHGEDFAAINPKGYVPALLLDSGELITEGPAIVQFIADRHPEAGLAPTPGTVERAQLQGWLNFIATEVHKNFSPLFRQVAPAWQEAARAAIERQFGYLSRHLATQPYLTGRFSVADAYLFTVLGWPAFLGFDLSPWPELQAYVGRIADRPRVQEALRAEGLAG